MSAIKVAMKKAAASFKAKQWPAAVEAAQEVLAIDKDNYQARLILGFAYDQLAKLPEAEEQYLYASRLKPNDAQPWQGLIKLFEQQKGAKIDEYQNVATQLAVVYMQQDDKFKCQDVVDKFTAFAKTHGSRQQLIRSLNIVLPSSPIYEYLEGRIPHPGHTIQTLAMLVETDEKEHMNKEIGIRRTRLGAKINAVTLEVKREIFATSPLEQIYQDIIGWVLDDEIRRQYEEKLIQRCYDALLAAPVAQQAEKRAKLEQLCRDMVIIKHPFKLAWDIDIEWKDFAEIEQWDVNVLREYVSFFPRSGLSKVLAGFLASEVSPFPKPALENEKGEKEESEDDDDGGGVSISPIDAAADRLVLMTEGMSDAQDSVLAHRLMATYYEYLEEHESVIGTCRAGLALISSIFQKTEVTFPSSSQSLNALLATALVFFQSPRHHPEAMKLFIELLGQNPTSTKALLGTGLIYEEDEDYTSAIDFLARALERAPDNIRIRVEAAWAKALNGDYETSCKELEECLMKMDPADVKQKEIRAETLYRIGFCIWNIDTSKAARRDRSKAYSYFLASLKANMNYAPAYTSIGIFYADYAKDKKRARKCFQKAFELSPSEVTAAHRLAQSFAAHGEWELVEAVSQRVVDSGKVKPAPGSKKKGISWPFAALGVAELNKQDYTRSIASFQAALRIAPTDYHCWVGLGESYHNSGRFVAATKAFTHALTFEKEIEKENAGDTWFAKYMLANVKRELGAYDDAIERYAEVLNSRSDEFGVRLALLQTYVESAWDSIDKGLFGQAADRANKAIIEGTALIGMGHSSAFNVWKCLGDATAVFSYVQGRLSEYSPSNLGELLKDADGQESSKLMQDIDGVDLAAMDNGDDADDRALLMKKPLYASILCHKRSIAVSVDNTHAQAVAQYNLGWAEFRAHTCLRPSVKKHTTYLKAAVRCFKRAIELEAGNSEFWNALGVVTSDLSPKVAQHAFVRSLYLNERGAHVWVNYGTLALLQNDMQLANESFTRAQSTDPEYSSAWVGQGIIALMLGDPKEAQMLFNHAIEISNSSSTLTKRQYALSTFDQLVKMAATTSVEHLVQPIFAMNQLQALTLNELPFMHLASLFLERAHDTVAALGLLNKIGGICEEDFEVTESPDSMSRFALVKADQARMQLATGDYDAAIESGETSLGLSEEDAGNNLTPEQRRLCRVSAHLTVGLAHYHNSNPSEAISLIEAALAESANNPDATCILAQILWAMAQPTSTERARDILFAAIEAHPGHLQSILLLGAVALVDEDADTLSAVIDELHTIRSTTALSDAEQADIGEILRAAGALMDSNPDRAVLAKIQSDVVLFPSLPAGWSRLAAATGGEEAKVAAEMAVKTAVAGAPPRGEVESEELGMAYAGTGKAGDAQRSIMCAPWRSEGWVALGGIRG